MTELCRSTGSQASCRRVRARLLLTCVLAVCMTALDAMPAELPPIQLLDGFDDIRSWHVATSDDVHATLRLAAGNQGNALCMDFDFGAVSGYAVARRELPLEYGDNYEFSFDLRGTAPNTLQFKLVDASGQNVWWVNRPGLPVPA
jgi:hypothetical protein